jgi:hypothetical protein
VLGVLYVHFNDFDVSLPPDPTTSPAYQGTHGDTSYYFFETQDLPLFGPLRTLGVPESVIDVFEPFFRAIVELGYDRSIPPWEPTPARLIPMLDPAKVATDLVDAIGEGINNAAALVGSPAPLSTPAPVTTATAGPMAAPPATETAKADITPQVTLTATTGTATETAQTSTDTAAASTTNVTETDPTTSTQTATETDQARPSTAADTSEGSPKPTQGLSVSASTKPAKPAGRPAPRPMVRDSLGQQRLGLPHRGKGDPPAAPGDEAAGDSSAASSPAASSSTANRSSSVGASGGDGS